MSILGTMEYITECAVPLSLIPKDYRHPLAQQFEEIDEDGDLIRSYDEWGLASVLTYAYTRQIALNISTASLEEIMGMCLEGARHSRNENIDLFYRIKRSVKSGDSNSVLPYTATLIARLGGALAEQHDSLEQ